MTGSPLPKSILYASAIKDTVLPRLFNSNAHVGVIDLEDGVPISMKAQGRQNLMTFRDSQISHNSKTQYAIRINEIASTDGLEDLLLIKNKKIRPDIIIMSMVLSGADVDFLKRFIASFTTDQKPKIFVTIECPQAISNIKSIANAADGLIFGSADYCASLGISIGGWEKLLYARCSIVNAATEFGIPAYDTAFFILEDKAGLIEESEKVKELGFFGKTAIHPQQIDIINQIFTPTSQEITEAKNLIEQYKMSAEGIIRMDKKMVGPPFYKLAQKVLLKANEF